MIYTAAKSHCNKYYLAYEVGNANNTYHPLLSNNGNDREGEFHKVDGLWCFFPEPGCIHHFDELVEITKICGALNGVVPANPDYILYVKQPVVTHVNVPLVPPVAAVQGWNLAPQPVPQWDPVDEIFPNDVAEEVVGF